jgi:integrase
VLGVTEDVANARSGFFEAADFERLVAALPDYLQDAARFAMLTGWRKSEIVSLRWEWVDPAAKMITLPTTKNGQPRTLALDGEAAEILARREADRLTERHGEPMVASHVFHRKGRRLGDFKRSWASARIAASLPAALFHDLRRTAVRNLIRSGVPESLAMGVTGHKTRAVFDRYAIASGADMRKAMRAVSTVR